MNHTPRHQKELRLHKSFSRRRPLHSLEILEMGSVATAVNTAITKTTLLFWSLLLLFATLPQPTNAQELPDPAIASEQFSKSAFFRQNVCDLQEAFHNKSVALKDALRGQSITTYLVQSEYFELDPRTGGIHEDYPGLKAVILDKLAQRAGFTWRNSYAVTGETPEGNHTWTELLQWSAEAYDVSADWWAFSVARVSSGITFPEGWYDGSIILVARTEDNSSSDSSFSFWSFLRPFANGVWWLILLTIFFSGFVYWVLENIDQNSDRQQLETNIWENIWLSAITFTTHFEFRPRTNAARMFTLSLSFWAMLVAAAYTANLASFLVVRNVPSMQIDSISDAVRYQVKICTQRSAQSDLAVSSVYPNANYVRKGTEKEVLAAVRDGECTVAVTTVSTWDNWQRNAEINGQCNMNWIGRPFKIVPAGFATISDSGTYCTSLITDVLNLHMHILKEEGFIAEAWEQHLERKATVDCTALGNDESTDDIENEQLTIENMGGIFFFHGLMSVAALLVALVYKYTGWDQIPRFAKTGPMSRKSVRETLGSMSKSQEQADEVGMAPTHRQLFKAASRRTVGEVLKRGSLEATKSMRNVYASEPSPGARPAPNRRGKMISSAPVLPRDRTNDLNFERNNPEDEFSNFGNDETDLHSEHDSLFEDLLIHDLHGPAAVRNASRISSNKGPRRDSVSSRRVTFVDEPSSALERGPGPKSEGFEVPYERESLERLSQRQEEQMRRQEEQMSNMQMQISQIKSLLEKNEDSKSVTSL